MIIKMREDLAEEGMRIPANNNNNYYDCEQVANMEFLYCVDELGSQDEDGAFYAMKTKDGELVHLYSIDLDFYYDEQFVPTTPEAYQLQAQSYFKLPYNQRGDAHGN